MCVCVCRHIAKFVGDSHIALTQRQVPMVLQNTSIILGMERLICMSDLLVQDLNETEYASLSAALMTCDSTRWAHESSESVIPHVCDCGHKALQAHFTKALARFPTTFEEDELYLQKLQSQCAVAVDTDGSPSEQSTQACQHSVKDYRRINAVR